MSAILLHNVFCFFNPNTNLFMQGVNFGAKVLNNNRFYVLSTYNLVKICKSDGPLVLSEQFFQCTLIHLTLLAFYLRDKRMLRFPNLHNAKRLLFGIKKICKLSLQVVLGDFSYLCSRYETYSCCSIDGNADLLPV